MTINKCQLAYLGEEIGKSQCKNIQLVTELYLRDCTFEKVSATLDYVCVAVLQECKL